MTRGTANTGGVLQEGTQPSVVIREGFQEERPVLLRTTFPIFVGETVSRTCSRRIALVEAR